MKFSKEHVVFLGASRLPPAVGDKVDRVKKAISRQGVQTHRKLGLLDIYGFEVLRPPREPFFAGDPVDWILRLHRPSAEPCLWDIPIFSEIGLCTCQFDSLVLSMSCK